MRNIFYIIAIISFASILCGCGYHAGSLMNPQVKTIAIAPITNDTMEINLSDTLRQRLCEEFVVDSSLKVKSLESADCILYTRIIKVETTTTAYDTTAYGLAYTPAAWALNITVEFTVIIPGRAEPLIAKRQVSANNEFPVTNDPAVARASGLNLACKNLAKQMVIYTTEAW